MIQLHCETSGYCNAKCSFCPYNSEENKALPKGFMTWALYTKIIDEAATIPQITSVAFSGLSEPLTDKLIEQRIAYAKRARPEWLLEMYTNGTMLTPTRFEMLKDAGLSCISISLNAVNAAQHESIMGLKGKFNEVCENIRYARAHKGDMRLLVKAVVNGDNFTRADAAVFNGVWGIIDQGDGIGGLVMEMNWAGKTRLIEERKPDFNATCLRALEQISVSWAGHVNLCCLDPYGKYRFGDLNTQTIKEVYNSAGYVEFREWHRDGVAAKHPECAKCTRV